jgi:two-component system LytT family response regulator
MVKALILDDEQKARSILEHYIKSFIPEVSELRQAGSVEEALALLGHYDPDLIFLDVEMPHRNGFDFLASVKDPKFDVIFTTAYNQYAIQAIRFSALDYLLKPVDPEELRASVRRHTEKQETETAKKELYSNLVGNIGKTQVKDFRIAVTSTDGVHFFGIDEILRLEADSSYTRIYLTNRAPFVASKTLKHFEEMLAEFGFIRTHKSHLVNPRFVSRITNDNEFILLKDGSRVEVSRRKKDEVLQQLKVK